MAFLKTDIVDVLDKHGAVVMELDATDVRKAAREFALKWNDGVIDRVLKAKVGDATMDRTELAALAGRTYRDEFTFSRRYMRGTEPVHPEGGYDERGFDVKHTALALDVKDAISELCGQAWSHGVAHIESTKKTVKANLAVTDGERYLQGLAEVAKLDAMHQLKSAISNMSDPAAKAEMVSKFPELFSDSAMTELAQLKSHGEA